MAMVFYSGTLWFFFFQAEDGIRDVAVTGVQTCALPISALAPGAPRRRLAPPRGARRRRRGDARGARARRPAQAAPRSEEHTSELQSRLHLVCRLLLEKKNQLTRVELVASIDTITTIR